jgi:hypothetical protein
MIRGKLEGGGGLATVMRGLVPRIHLLTKRMDCIGPRL